MANVRAKQMKYLDKEQMKTFDMWHPQVKVDGKWAFLSDKTTTTGLKEAKDEEAALEQAIEGYRAMREVEADHG